MSKNEAKKYFESGIKKYKLEDYIGAIEDFDKVIEIDNNYKEAYYNRGVVRDSLKDYTRAIEDYSKVIELDPEYKKAYCNRGNARYNLKDYARTILDYNKAIEIDNNYKEAYYNRGVVRDSLKDYTRAIEDYNKAIEIDNNYKEVYYNRGNLKNELKDYTEAILDYSKAIKIDNNYKEAYNNLGNIKYKLKNYKEAIENYNKAIELDSNYEIAIQNKQLAQEEIETKHGYLTFADILGWKGIWQKKENSESNLVMKLLDIKTKLSKIEKIKVDLISDTFVISSDELKNHLEVSKKLIELCLEKKFLIRGATSYGKYYTKDMVYIGSAVDESASWHELGEEVGILFTPSARLKNKGYQNDDLLIKRKVQTKQGVIDTFFINWASDKNMEKFYEIMENSLIFPELNKKYSNTEIYFGEYLKRIKQWN